MNVQRQRAAAFERRPEVGRLAVEREEEGAASVKPSCLR